MKLVMGVPSTFFFLSLLLSSWSSTQNKRRYLQMCPGKVRYIWIGTKIPQRAICPVLYAWHLSCKQVFTTTALTTAAPKGRGHHRVKNLIAWFYHFFPLPSKSFCEHQNSSDNPNFLTKVSFGRIAPFPPWKFLSERTALQRLCITSCRFFCGYLHLWGYRECVTKMRRGKSHISWAWEV